MQNDRSAFGGIRVFVEVHRHRGNAGYLEIERAELRAQALEERQEEAADTAVDVKQQIVLLSDTRDLFDRVQHAMRVRYRRRDDQDRIRRDRFLDCRRVRLEGLWIDRHQGFLDARVV